MIIVISSSIFVIIVITIVIIVITIVIIIFIVILLLVLYYIIYTHIDIDEQFFLYLIDYDPHGVFPNRSFLHKKNGGGDLALAATEVGRLGVDVLLG